MYCSTKYVRPSIRNHPTVSLPYYKRCGKIGTAPIYIIFIRKFQQTFKLRDYSEKFRTVIPMHPALDDPAGSLTKLYQTDRYSASLCSCHACALEQGAGDVGTPLTCYARRFNFTKDDSALADLEKVKSKLLGWIRLVKRVE
jgi:hypothetical protein